MKKVHVLVEGQTEETFIRDVLGPHLESRNIFLSPTLAMTKRVKSGRHFKGGIVSYGKLKNDIIRLLHDTSTTLVTTQIDFYGLPADFPGHKSMKAKSCYKRVEYLEEKFQEDINHAKFLPYLALHEFEAMMFVEPIKIAQVFPAKNVTQDLQAIRNQFNSPEEIDEDPQTAPSKRIEILLPEYRKPLHGSLIASAIGLDRIRQECPHFDEWCRKLEALAE